MLVSDREAVEKLKEIGLTTIAAEEGDFVAHVIVTPGRMADSANVLNVTIIYTDRERQLWSTANGGKLWNRIA